MNKAKRYQLRDDIKSMYHDKITKKPVVYGKRFEIVVHVSDHCNVMIVENSKGNRFAVNVASLKDIN